MHVVFVTSLVPDANPASGYDIANRAIADALRSSGVRLSVIGFTSPGNPPEFPDETTSLGEIDVRTDSADLQTRLVWLARSLRHGVPVSSGKLRVVGARSFSEILRKLEPVDAFVLNGTTLAGAFERELTAKPYLFIAHNVEHRSARQNAGSTGSMLNAKLYAREARLLEALEKRLCAGARFVFTLAEEDRAALGVKDDARSAVLPLTTVRTLVKQNLRRAISCDLAMIGTWTWMPNRIGLDWFLAEVLPNLPAKMTIRIAGAIPRGYGCADPRVRFVGRVDNAPAFVKSGAVVPLASRAGTGVQLKTIETFENGLPSVATSLAVRAIRAIPTNCTVTDDPTLFAEAIAEKVQAIRGGRNLDLDGSTFHAAQRAGINQAIGRGLETVMETVG
jgi:hypothetical protein